MWKEYKEEQITQQSKADQVQYLRPLGHGEGVGGYLPENVAPSEEVAMFCSCGFWSCGDTGLVLLNTWIFKRSQKFRFLIDIPWYFVVRNQFNIFNSCADRLQPRHWLQVAGSRTLVHGSPNGLRKHLFEILFWGLRFFWVKILSLCSKFNTFALKISALCLKHHRGRKDVQFSSGTCEWLGDSSGKLSLQRT